MKLLHTADWHIGKELGGYSLLAEQKAAFQQIVQLAQQEKVDGIIIAGDLYDRAIAPTQAVSTLEEMLKTLNLTAKLPIYAVSGNHDGATRLGAGREWRAQTDLYLNTQLAEAFTPVETPEAQIYLLPFIDPAMARVYYGVGEDEADNYQNIGQIMTRIVSDMVATFKPDKAHILVTHYYVTGTQNATYELTSETNSQVGGLKSIDVQQFDAFDYVALGHLHLKQASPSQKVRYAGSPIKFNTKEAQTQKGVYIVDITENQVQTTWHDLTPVKDLIVLKAPYETLVTPAFYEQYERHGKNFFSIKLEGMTHAKNARADLMAIYGDVVEVQYDLPALQLTDNVPMIASDESLSDEQLIADFYQYVTDQPLTAKQEMAIEQTLVAIRQAEEG